MNIKENWKKYRKYILIGGATVLVVGGVIYIIKKGIPAKEIAEKVIPMVQSSDLPKPKWDDICNISEYWKEGSGINMILDAKAENLAEFAKRYVAEIAKDPDKIVSIIIGTTE